MEYVTGTLRFQNDELEETIETHFDKLLSLKESSNLGKLAKVGLNFELPYFDTIFFRILYFDRYLGFFLRKSFSSLLNHFTDIVPTLHDPQRLILILEKKSDIFLFWTKIGLKMRGWAVDVHYVCKINER